MGALGESTQKESRPRFAEVGLLVLVEWDLWLPQLDHVLGSRALLPLDHVELYLLAFG